MLGRIPIDFSSSTKKISDATALEVATVEEKIVWKIFIPFSRRLAATASITPSTRPMGTV